MTWFDRLSLRVLGSSFVAWLLLLLYVIITGIIKFFRKNEDMIKAWVVYHLLGFDDLFNPRSELRQALDRIAERDRR